jgi:hypothetical protein
VILLAIDPGPTESAWVLYNTEARIPVEWAKQPNEPDALVWFGRVAAAADDLAIEMVASYGMAVGADVFETVVWIGRFMERWEDGYGADAPRLVYRRDVKLHICGSSRAKDANVRQALIDRYGGKQRAVGLKASPGPLYGMTGDCWSALGVAITAAETSP